MVTYGPWQDSRIHEEVFTLKDSASTDRTIELLADAPTVRSGWDANHLAALGWSVSGSSGATFEGGIDNPPPADEDLSANAFAAAFNSNVGSGGGAAMQFELRQSGDQLFLTPPPRWEQDQGWEATGTGYRLWFDRDLNNQTGSALYAVPAEFEFDDDTFDVELETLGAYKPVELVEVTVLASARDETSLYVKDAHPAHAQPFLRSAVAQGGASTSINEAKNLSLAADADLALDHETLNDLAENGIPALGDDWSSDGRMPTMAILYDGLDRADATVEGEGFSATYEGQPVRIRIRYRWPRWRKVFYDGPPYRRITRRGDGLAGGARRTGGRVKTIQGSNRRGAGAIV
jgi:hypothetical protein